MTIDAYITEKDCEYFAAYEKYMEEQRIKDLAFMQECFDKNYTIEVPPRYVGGLDASR